MGIKNILDSSMDTIRKNGPEILTGLGVAAFVGSTVFAVVGTVKAVKKIESVKEERKKTSQGDEKLTKMEVVKSTGAYFIPSIALLALGTTCSISAANKFNKRNVALVTALGISERALVDYKEEVKKVLGPKKIKEVEENAVVSKAKITDLPAEEFIVNTGRGNALCYDAISGRWFRSSLTSIQSAANEVNRRLMDEMFIDLNDWYYELGLRPIAIGNELGFNIDDGFIEISKGSGITDNGTPYLVIDYMVRPRWR